MTIGEKGLNQIKKSEGFMPNLYMDQGKPAIGYGINLTPTQAEQYKNKTITEDEATDMLRNHLSNVEEFISRVVTVELTQNQFDALCSFTYNVGVGNLQTSTLLKKLNAGDYAGAAGEFEKWNKSGGKVLPGLIARRLEEKQLFESQS